jgi:hypothetical protein
MIYDIFLKRHNYDVKFFFYYFNFIKITVYKFIENLVKRY